MQLTRLAVELRYTVKRKMFRGQLQLALQLHPHPTARKLIGLYLDGRRGGAPGQLTSPHCIYRAPGITHGKVVYW